MAFAPLSQIDAGLVYGEFAEHDHGHWFNYSLPERDEYTPFPGYGMKVWVDAQGIGGDQGFRWAKVLRTVAYVVVDEAADGSPVTEKWFLKTHKEYAR